MIYEKNYELRLSDLDPEGTLTLHALLAVLGDIGSSHSSFAHDDVLKGAQSGRPWIQVEWKVRVLRVPKDRHLRVQTFSAGKTVTLTAEREYMVFNGEGELCISAMSRLVLVDMATGRFVKMPQEALDLYQPEDGLKHTFDFSRVREPAQYESAAKVSVRRGDIDFNGHVNNIWYIDYALEAVPDEWRGIRKISAFRVLYRKSLKYGDTADVRIHEDAEKSTLIAGIYRQDETLSAIVQFRR